MSGLLYVIWGPLLFLALCDAQRVVEVSSTRQVYDAIADEGVAEIVLQQGGAFNFTPAEFPAPLVLRRVLTLRGQVAPGGALPYVLGNRMMELVEVTAGGRLLQRDFIADDCISERLPVFCFSYASGGGHIEAHSVTVGDATCSNVNSSLGIDWMLRTASMAVGGSIKVTYLDARSLLIHDTLEVPAKPDGSTFRFINTTLTCTGGLHSGQQAAWDLGFRLALDDYRPRLGFVTTLLSFVVVAMLWWPGPTRIWGEKAMGLTKAADSPRKEDLPEVLAARARGIQLEAVIGRGTFGVVYLGYYRGRPVAVKVIQFGAHERARERRVARECAISASCQHANIVRHVLNFTVAVAVRRQPSLWRALPHRREDGDDTTRYLEPPSYVLLEGAAFDGMTAAPARFGRRVAAATARIVRRAAGLAPPPGSFTPSPRANSSPPSSSPNSSADGTGSSTSQQLQPEEQQGQQVALLMTFIVTQYCASGTLQQAIRNGTLAAHRSGGSGGSRGSSRGSRKGRSKSRGRTRGRSSSNGADLDLAAVVRTALDICCGLAHLHGRLGLVHRDLSTSNVLLMPDSTDPRGFRALLSDFGLSTMFQQEHAVMSTSSSAPLKGTLAFMPPEVFSASPVVHSSLDIYSLGIIVYCMCCNGKTPYVGMSPSEIVARKFKESQEPQALLLPAAVPESLRELILSCTHNDPTRRWTAQEAATYLERVLDRLV